MAKAWDVESEALASLLIFAACFPGGFGYVIKPRLKPNVNATNSVQEW